MKKTAVLLKNATVPHDPYQERFVAEGYVPRFVPLLTHTDYDEAETLAYLSSDEFVNGVPYFIITSQRAVEIFSRYLQTVSVEIRRRIFRKIGYTVGPATHEVLTKVGFEDVRGGENAGNGAKLAEIIHQDLGPAFADKIVFFTGEIRKDIIPKRLKELNYNLEEKIIYKTENRADIIANFVAEYEVAADHDDNWIVFFSPQGTEQIVQHIKTASHRKFNIASIGPTTEEYLDGHALPPKVVAAKPTAASLLESIVNHH